MPLRIIVRSNSPAQTQGKIRRQHKIKLDKKHFHTFLVSRGRVFLKTRPREVEPVDLSMYRETIMRCKRISPCVSAAPNARPVSDQACQASNDYAPETSSVPLPRHPVQIPALVLIVSWIGFRRLEEAHRLNVLLW